MEEDSKLESINSNLEIGSMEEDEDSDEDNVLKELEEFVRPRRKTKRNEDGADVYEMCD